MSWAAVRLADHAIVRDGLGPDATINDGEALWPIVEQVPTLDPATQDPGPVALTVDVSSSQVIAAPTVIDLDQAAIANRAAYALHQRKMAVCDAIDAHREGLLARGATYFGKVIQVDETSQQRIQAMGAVALACLQGATTWPDTLAHWVAADNSLLALATATDGLALALAMAAWVSAAIMRAVTLKAETRASDNPESIDITAGWPA
jgi:hypothetical protein